MRRVTVQAILTYRGVIPEKRTSFFRMAGVTNIIDGKIHEHLARLTTMRIVAGSAADLHVAILGAKNIKPIQVRQTMLVTTFPVAHRRRQLNQPFPTIRESAWAGLIPMFGSLVASFSFWMAEMVRYRFRPAHTKFASR